jgi:UDP-N-acetylglucosamine 1-carboxyvinyltransferase
MALTAIDTHRAPTRKFLIEGGYTLYGDYPVQGNKNAALPLICAVLLARSRVVLNRVPRIDDVENLLRLVRVVGVEAEWQGEDLHMDSSGLKPEQLPADLVEKLRGAILLLGPLAAVFGRVSCVSPGGCPIGRRSFNVHWSVLEAAGFRVREDSSSIDILKSRQVEDPVVYLEEASVTATENALLLFSALGGGTIRNPAREPHVLAVVDFLRELGCRIELHPLYYRVLSGVGERKEEVEFDVPPDYIDAGTLAIATAVTHGSVRLLGVGQQDLMGVIPVLERFGIEFRPCEGGLQVEASRMVNPSQLTAGPWPLFPTDLVSLVIVLATQAHGLCLVHDWMYEARMFFVDKLVRMGARITMCDPHRVLVEGPCRLRGKQLESPDIRAGMALLVAGLCAEGDTRIEHAEVVLRGYENVVDRLRGVGAKIRGES